MAGLERASDDVDFMLISSEHSENVWHHVLSSYDGTSLRLYVDGVLENSIITGPIAPYTGPAPLRIGNIRHAPAHLGGDMFTGVFDGLIDEVRIYGRALTDIEVTKLHEIPEPATPPVADADGPYSIYVGDTLVLDASGSTDADDDIVSYMWDLDDDENFETDAGAEVVLAVDYAYLQSLGLLINYTYTIHLKVTDSEGQSDVNDSTLIIVPKPATVVAVDIKPGGCPNPLNVKSSGVLPVAILGTDDYDITTIDPTSIRLTGVEPIRSSYEDVATPVSDSNDCNCTEEGPDGFLDLTLKFKTQRIAEAIGDVNHGDVLELPLTGVLSDETPIEGADCILIKGRHRSRNKADINGDGVVDSIDFAIIAKNWLQSSIVDE